jgi:DNA replication and repair protein RecF
MNDIRLERLALYNFKNYTEASLEFSEQVICFVGNNGSGKTNLLDAIHYLSSCKSFFNPVDSQNILTGNDQGSITGEFMRDGIPEQLVCAIRRNQRKVVKRNYKDYEKLSDHIGLLPSIIITPYDIELIWEGSEVRRKFLDATISLHSRTYLEHLLAYNHALLQRNNLLKTFASKGGYMSELLEPWNYHLAENGGYLFEHRKRFLDEFIPGFAKIYEVISGGNEVTAIAYESDLHEAPMADLLARNADRDRMLERTSSGIHRDDLDFSINGLPLKKFGSQGQQKSFLFALKLSQYLFIREHQQVNPILMLDDLFDKIDEARMDHILKWLSENRVGQVFITDTHLQRIPSLLTANGFGYEVWQVENGSVRKMESAGKQPDS